MNIAFLGDIAFMDEKILSGDWKKTVENLRPIVKNADYVIGNLETPLTDRRSTMVCKGIHIKSDKRVCNILQGMSVDAVSLANNHMFDFGKRGLEDTIATLEDASISYFGLVGCNDLVIDDKIAIHGFCCHSTNAAGLSSRKENRVVPLERDLVVQALERDKERGLFSVLSIHWGDEYSHYPSLRQVKFVEELAKKYAFVIQGNHTHSIQGIQRIGGCLVSYSQGNLYFDKCVDPTNPKLVICQSEETRKTYVFTVDLSQSPLDFQCFGLMNNDGILDSYDIDSELRVYSEGISRVCEEGFAKKAALEAASLRGENHCPHDLAWLMSKLNYHSIGAKLLSYRNARLFRKAY